MPIQLPQPLTDELGKHAPDLAGSHPAALAVRQRESQWSADMSENFMRITTQGDDHYRLTKALGFESYLSVPLLADGEAIGALTLVTAGSGRTIGSEELWLAEDLAAQVATVIRRARAFDEQTTIARHLQSSLLPQSVDQNPRITVAVRYVTGDRGTQVGGDFYDVIPLPKGHVALVIGDVEGHDMTAATVMGQLRSALRAYLMLNRDPGVVLSLLNEFALKSESPRLATATLAVLNSESGEIELASAGHPAPLMSVGQTQATSVPLTTGPPLGVHRYTYPVVTSTLQPGARLVFYTDGLIDVGRPGAEQKLAQLALSMASHPREHVTSWPTRFSSSRSGRMGRASTMSPFSSSNGRARLPGTRTACRTPNHPMPNRRSPVRETNAPDPWVTMCRSADPTTIPEMHQRRCPDPTRSNRLVSRPRRRPTTRLETFARMFCLRFPWVQLTRAHCPFPHSQHLRRSL